VTAHVLSGHSQLLLTLIVSFMQVVAGIAMKPPKTSNLRRAWNLTHWTLGRAGLALGIADIFFGMYLSSVAYKNIIAQAVVLGGLFIIVMLKNDIEYLLVGITPAQEEERLRAAKLSGVPHLLCLQRTEKQSTKHPIFTFAVQTQMDKGCLHV